MYLFNRYKNFIISFFYRTVMMFYLTISLNCFFSPSICKRQKKFKPSTSSIYLQLFSSTSSGLSPTDFIFAEIFFIVPTIIILIIVFTRKLCHLERTMYYLYQMKMLLYFPGCFFFYNRKNPKTSTLEH